MKGKEARFSGLGNGKTRRRAEMLGDWQRLDIVKGLIVALTHFAS